MKKSSVEPELNSTTIIGMYIITTNVQKFFITGDARERNNYEINSFFE